MGTDAAAVIETHVSWVFLFGDRAYKLKKPVRTGFLDFSTVEARRRACEEEVRVNRRLAPDVYLGVDTVSDEAGGVVDHLVAMRRMPAGRRLSTLVADSVDVEDAVRDIARRVAALHLASDRSPADDEAASAAATLRRWEANNAEIGPHAHLLADPSAPGRVSAAARTYVLGRGRLFAERVAAGRAVDGHGDLLADDIFALDDGPRILDASSSTNGCGSVMGSPMSRSSPWTSTGSAPLDSRAGCSAGMRNSPPTGGRRDWPTTTSPTGPRYV